MSATFQRFRHCFGALATAGVLALAGTALAGPVADKATEVETATTNGDFLTAMKGAQEISDMVWEATPGLIFTETLPVAELAAGYGLYNPRPDTIYKAGEEIILYAEPFGFGYGVGGEGLFTIGFAVDLQVLDETGGELANVQNVTELNLASRYKNREFQANLTYNLDGIEPGKYRLITTLRDKNSAKTGSFETAIEIVK